MRICSLRVTNFRTLESTDLTFPSAYSVLCGRNDSGKSNVLRVIRTLFKDDDPYGIRNEQEVSIKDDFTKWKEADTRDRRITVAVDASVHRDADAGLYQFLATYLSLGDMGEELTFSLELTHAVDEPAQRIVVSVGGQRFEGLKAQEVLKKLQSSRVVLFHNSTDPEPLYRFSRRFGGISREVPPEHTDRIEKMKRTIDRGLEKIARSQQERLAELLGRLENKYRVGLSLPTFNLEYLPFTVTLGDRKIDVDLDDWGSGTRNRTLILLTLFRARQISQSGASASKITPMVVIEEPESFLHPSAQAEFGRILQEMAEEFRVQVIATSHSPYMLSQAKPESNILLERRVMRRQFRETVRVDTSGDNWMIPFGLALGVNNKDFEPWQKALFGQSEAILLVEGEVDREYFELLRDPAHGQHQLSFKGEIFAYGGRDALRNTVLLRFIKNRFKKLLITFDLDAMEELQKTMDGLGLRPHEHYVAIGLNLPGKKNIEGLLPEEIIKTVWGTQPHLVQQAMNGTSDERRSANQKLKGLLLQEFKSKAIPGGDLFKNFYPLVRLANKALN